MAVVQEAGGGGVAGAGRAFWERGLEGGVPEPSLCVNGVSVLHALCMCVNKCGICRVNVCKYVQLVCMSFCECMNACLVCFVNACVYLVCEHVYDLGRVGVSVL